MQALKLPASAGIDWLRKGFAIFKQRPALFIFLAFIWNFNTIISIQLLGFFGLFSVALVQPLYIAFILLFCDFISEDKKFSFGDAFKSFSESNQLKALLLAGLIYGVILFVLEMFFTPSLLKESEVAKILATSTQGEMTAESYAAIAGAINPVTIIVMFVYTVVLTLVYWFVPALILWDRVEVIKSIVFSTIGVIRNIPAFITMAIPALGIGFVIWSLIVLSIFSGSMGAFVAFILQLLLISLLMTIYCAMYVSYKQIYQR